MNDKVPPRNPFGIPGERTVIRPNPGGRRPVAPAPMPGAPPAPYSPVPAGYGPPQPAAPAATPYVPPAAPGNPNPDEWITAQAQAPPQPIHQVHVPEVRIDELVAPNENPILRSAGPLLLLLGRLHVGSAGEFRQIYYLRDRRRYRPEHPDRGPPRLDAIQHAEPFLWRAHRRRSVLRRVDAAQAGPG